MIVKHWPESFKAGYGYEFPQTYVAFDLETTGFDRKKDVVIEIGHILVEEGVVTDELSVLLDWSKNSVVPNQWLQDRIADLRRHMSDQGIAHHLPYERLCDEGIDPLQALEFYRDFFARLKERGMPVVGHNVYRFDEPFFEANLVGFQLADEFSFGDWQLWDTLPLEAATQFPNDKKAIPKPGQTLRDWMTKASYIKAQTNLTRTLLKKYNLAEKYSLDTKESHSACYDARLCHHMMQEFGMILARDNRELLPVDDVLPEPTPEAIKIATVPIPAPAATRPKGRVPGDQPTIFDNSPPPVVHGDPSRRRRQRNR